MGAEGTRTSIEVSSGSAGTYRLTELSGQGLPSLLPLGWSPLRAVDLRGAENVPAALSLHATGLTDVPFYLAQHGEDGWRLVSGPYTRSADGGLTMVLTPLSPVAAGAALVVALVVPDDGVVVPAAGEPLPASAMVPIPVAATSTGTVDPPTIARQVARRAAH